MKRNSKIIAVTLFGLVLVTLWTLYLHHLIQEEVLSKYQEHQFLHAQNLSDHIKSFYSSHCTTLQAILSSSRYEGMKRLRVDVRLYAEQMEAHSIKVISLCDEFGKTIYSTEPGSIGLNNAESKFFTWAVKKENMGKIFVSSLAPVEWIGQTGSESSLKSNSEDDLSRHGLKVLLAVPVYQEVLDNGDSRPRKRFIGVLSFQVDSEELLVKELEDAKLSAHNVWIMRRDGTLLFHSKHSEMVFRNITLRQETCNSCHISLGYVEMILKEREGQLDYEVKGGPKKLAAFVPMEFENMSWIVVVNSNYDTVTAFVNKSLRGHFVLLALVFLAFTSGSALFIREDRLKIRAEEETKRWQEIAAQRKKVEEELKESANRLRFLSDELLKAQETERKRITRELHDELGQALAGLKIRLSLIGKKSHGNQGDLRDQCEEALHHLNQMMENVRRAFHDLSPHVLEYFGLTVALQRLIRDFIDLYKMKVTQDIVNIDRLVPKEVQIIVYRIFQEALNNIGKHAQATQVSLAVKREDHSINLIVEDDGKGFSMDQAVPKSTDGKGLGLAILEERVRMLGGMLDLRSQVGKGTRIAISIPVSEEDADNG